MILNLGHLWAYSFAGVQDDSLIFIFDIMQFIQVKTRVMVPPRDDVYSVLDAHLPVLCEGDVVIITSKVLAIHQGRCVKMSDDVDKDDLIIGEAERYIPRSKVPNGNLFLTIKDYTLIPSAGIDESNGNGYYILWPKRTNALLKQIRLYLMKKFHLKKLGVIATDSHTIPLRYGVIGISTGFVGLEPLYDYRGKPDIFGRKLKFTKSNFVDALSAMAVLLMGEGKECMPVVIVRGASFVRFTDRLAYKKLVIPPDKDIYSPLLDVFKRR